MCHYSDKYGLVAVLSVILQVLTNKDLMRGPGLDLRSQFEPYRTNQRRRFGRRWLPYLGSPAGSGGSGFAPSHRAKQLRMINR